MFEIQNRRYAGNKYKLMNWIREKILSNCEGNSFLDIFAGTGAVTDYLIKDYNSFIVNDFLFSNEVIYKGFWLQEKYNFNKLIELKEKYNSIDKTKIPNNYVSENYGNKYFNIYDAKLIGYIREDLEKLKEDNKISKKEFDILLTSLLYSLDKIANTCGHYDAYRKIDNIKSTFQFELIKPENLGKKKIKIYREDANLLAKKVQADIAFIDPPYNSRQYSRFYHVLENITEWNKPKLYGTALKPREENMSNYCRNSAPETFEDLIKNLNVKYIVVTYNNTYNSKSSSSRNKITLEQIYEILNNKGKTQIFDKEYKAFNAGKTDIKGHKEYLFITKVGKNE